MAQLTLQGNPIQSLGTLPTVGAKAPDFTLVASDLSEKKLADYKGSRLVLNIFPSIDTGTCAASVRAFNKAASSLKNTKVLCVSRDLPFAMSRFCGAEGLENVETLSDFRDGKLGKDYQLEIVDGPIQKLHSRVIIVLDEDAKILHTEQVSEIADEPNYDAVLAVL
ncbi:thiol peroxidase [Aquimarina agarilytica]|uniref:thiol peroxidase n=1 Tax=Aquimarina agarilytica TaxID=1087449 RepID=UPI00028914AE|nr:thiol peroxidase [Aquimarina agarilytica]